MSSTVLRRWAKDILWRVGNNEISPSIYDTAWACLIEHQDGEQMFPDSLQWIRSVQLPDGSWGSYPEYVHDRVVCTMSAIMALQRWNQGRDQIQKGIEYIEQNAHRLEDEEPTVAFEKIIFVLQEKIASFGLEIKLPEMVLQKYGALSQKKQFLEAHPSMLSRSIMHSLELFSEDFLRDIHQYLKSISAHRNIVGYSPAATAAMIMALQGHPDQAGYIAALKGKMTDFTLPVVTDFDVFETVWAVLNVHTSGLLRGSERPFLGRLNMLRRAWSDQDGIGWAGTMGVKDLDDTALTYFLLRQYGDEPNERVFEYFEAEDHFRCFLDESTASVSHQAHLLLASSQFKDKAWAKHVQEKIIRFLHQAPKDEHGLWVDKWNISDIYATSRVLMASRVLGLREEFYTELASFDQFINRSLLFYEEAGYASVVGEYSPTAADLGDDSLWIEKIGYRPTVIMHSFSLLRATKSAVERGSLMKPLSPTSRRFRLRRLFDHALPGQGGLQAREMVRLVEWIFALDDLMDNPEVALGCKLDVILRLKRVEQDTTASGYLDGELARFYLQADQSDPEVYEHFLDAVQKLLDGMRSEAAGESDCFREYSELSQFSIGAPMVIWYMMALQDLDYHDSIARVVLYFSKYIRYANDLFSAEKELSEGVQNSLTFISKLELQEEMRYAFDGLTEGIDKLSTYYVSVGQFVSQMSRVARLQYESAEDYDGRIRRSVLA